MNKRLKKFLASRPGKDDSTLTQQQKVARALLKGEKVSPLGALYKFGTFRLAAIIHCLRHDYRMAVKTTMTKVMTKYGWAKVAIYTYERRR